jgi:predicted transcriptional regulator
MSEVRIELPDELAQRLHDLAASRGATDEQIAAEAVAAYLEPGHRLSFTAMAASGTTDTSERIEEILHARFSR